MQSKITSLNGVLTIPEVKLNFVLYVDSSEEESKGTDARTMSRILEKASDLSPEMQTLIADFADYLAGRREK